MTNAQRNAVTGPDWSGRVMEFRSAPAEYNAIAFHQDDMTDAGWDQSITWQVPKNLQSGAYCLEITCDDGADQIPFFVLPDVVNSKNKIVFLAPTFSYLAYANEHHWWTAPDIVEVAGGPLEDVLSPGEKWAEALGMRSCYDRHADGTGCAHSSWLRPIVNFRPYYIHPYLKATHQFGADLYILDWLRLKGYEFDVITDHDLHSQGADILEPYKVLLTGSHPEYVSGEILDAINIFLNHGGNAMYLGGNGFHSVGTVYPKSPYVFELRRGHSGGLHWKSSYGEDYHAATGEPGGLWKLRNRAAQRTFGVGTASVIFSTGKPYQRTEESYRPEYEWVFKDFTGEYITAKSDLFDEPAGFEYDRMDTALGSPPETVCLATARFDLPVTEYTSNDSRWTGYPAENRCDIVLIEKPSKGSVFSVGSIAWTAAFFDRDGDNAVSLITNNVLSKFLAEKDSPI